MEILIFFSGQQMTLKRDDEGVKAFVGSFGMTELPIPSVYNGIVLERAGEFIIFKGFDAYMRWDGDQTITIRTEPHLQGKTCGLCGNYDGDSANDLTTMDHTVTKSPVVFGNSWKMPDPSFLCQDAPNIHMCSAFSTEELNAARSKCKVLASNEFASCHKILDVEPWIEMCINDFCAGNGICETATAYFRECSRLGMPIHWRNANRCPLECSSGKVYRQCGSSCPLTCRQTAYICDEQCVDGCHCEPGKFLQNGTCIEKNECPCFSRGEEHANGNTIQEDCNTCTCVTGQWECTKNNCEAVCKVQFLFCKGLQTIILYS